MALPLQVPPETIWPTGATPPELAAALHAEGLKTPEEVRRERVNTQPPPNQVNLAEVVGQERYLPPPRPAPNLVALEQERLLHQANMPLPAPPVPSSAFSPPPPGYIPPVPPSLTYSLPLGHGKHAEIRLYGPIGPPDIKLLLRHIRLMQSIEPPPVASRPPEEPKFTFTVEPNGTLSPKPNGKKPRKA